MGINYSFNADIWSLGIIIYECCTGQVYLRKSIDFGATNFSTQKLYCYLY